MTVPSYFTLTGQSAPEGTVRPLHNDWLAVLRYHRHVTGRDIYTGPATARRYRMAVDAWDLTTRAHIWRTWDAEQGESADTWAERTHGVALSDHDNGPWAVEGLDGIADWPVPTDAAMEDALPVTLSMAHAAMVSLCAVAAYDGAPPDMSRPIETGSLVTAPTLYDRGRAGPIYAAWVVPLARTIAMRAYLVEAPPETPHMPEGVLWRATLRDIDRDAVDMVATFHAPADASTRTLSSAARRVLGLLGRPSRRTPDTLTWRVFGTAWEFDIRREDHGA